MGGDELLPSSRQLLQRLPRRHEHQRHGGALRAALVNSVCMLAHLKRVATAALRGIIASDTEARNR